MAIVWKTEAKRKERNAVFKAVSEKEELKARELSGAGRKKALKEFAVRDGWHRGSDVDRLSEEEAGIIAARLVGRIQAKVSVSEEKAKAIRSEFTGVFKRRFLGTQEPDRFEPWPGRKLIERTFVLLDVGVSFANPCWVRARNPDGTLVEVDLKGRDSWYVDLVAVRIEGKRYTFRDLYIDAIVPTDGRHYRMLDLDEYADAMISGNLSLEEAADGLRRWQRFLD